MTDAARALVISEVFPPAIGGSGELLKNVYSRLDDVRVTVWCDALPGVAVHERAAMLEVERRPMRATQWGLLHPAGLGHHLREAGRLRSFCRRRRVVVHCARALPEGVGAWMVRLGGAPYVCWAHGEDIASARGSRELQFLLARVLRGANAILANSRNTATMLEAVGIASNAVEVVYPGVDTVRFRPHAAGSAVLRASAAPQGQLVLLTVGRLQRRKGHDLVLRALAGIDRQVLPFRYLVVGDGQERARLEQMVCDLGLSDAVIFTGAVDRDQLPAFYAAANIFVHPNRRDGDDIEGFGIVFLEAAAAGLPVIGGRSGGVPEAVVDGVTGLLVSGTDVEECRSALSALMTAPNRRDAIATAGRARVEREFTWERAAGRVRQVHERVAARISESGRRARAR